MASRMNLLKEADMRLLAALWRELADAPACECDAALRRCLERLCGLIGADNIHWVAACRPPGSGTGGPMLGWQIKDTAYLHDGERLRTVAREVVHRLSEGETDPLALAVARNAGTTRSQLREELVDDETWRNCWFINEVRAADRVGDRLGGAFAFADCESHFFLERGRGDRAFDADARDLLHFFLLGSGTFQRELLLSRGLAEASSPFSQRERDVLKLLLTDATEKEIAQRLGIGYRTVHQHAGSIYVKLGVRGRQGLMARWLRYRAKAAG